MKPEDTPAEGLGQLNIELAEDIAEGIYSNLVVIANSNEEFVLDFVRVLPGVPKARVKARILMTPQHAKRLLFALQDNIGKYENMFGEIRLTDPAQPLPPLTFGGPTGVA
jgi:hypothetical protein